MLNKLKIFLRLFFTLVFLSGCASQQVSKRSIIDIDKHYLPKELKEDLKFMFQTFENVHPNLYAHTSKNVIDSEKAVIERKIDHPMTAFEFGKLITPLVVKLGDGHTYLQFPQEFWQNYLDKGGKVFPFEILVSEDLLIVKKNYTNDSTMAVNSKIVSINNVPAKDIIQTMLNYIGGERIKFRKKRLQKHFVSLLWALYDFKSDFNINYISAKDKQTYIKTFSGIPSKKFDGINKEVDSKQNDILNSYHSLSNKRIGIIDLKSFGGRRKDFEIFFKNTFTKIQKDSIQDIIIDIRENGGGNSYNGDALFDYITDKPYMQIEQSDYKISKELKEKFKQRAKRHLGYAYYILYPLLYIHPDARKIFTAEIGTHVSYKNEPYEPQNNSLLFRGNVYLLTSQYTFSAAVDFASAFKCYQMGTILGEETGGLTVCFIDIVHITLPNTKLSCGVSDKKNINACGKDDGRGVLPDYEVKQSLEDIARNIDTVMEFTKEYIRKNRSNKM